MSDTPAVVLPVATESEAPRRRLRADALLPVGSLILFMVLWELATRYGDINELIVPKPEAVLRSLWIGLVGGSYWPHIGVTLGQALAGYFIAMVAGVGIGALIAQFWLVERTVYPYLVALQTLPKIALAPLIIIWFGYGISSKIVIAALLSFFPILVSTIAGLKNCDLGRIDVMRALRASEWQIFWWVRLPSAFPFIFAGFNVAAVLAVLGAIVGEFVGSKMGLGNIMLEANASLDIAQVFSILVILGVIGVSLHTLIQVARRRVLFWSDAESLEKL